MTGIDREPPTETDEPRRLYRTMVTAEDRSPICGTGNTELGVRPGPLPDDDVHPDSEGQIAPGGGMSTFVHPKYLPKFLRPESLGGMSRLPVFEISEAELQNFGLVTKKKHVQVEPPRTMSLTKFLQDLCATRQQWIISL